MSTVLAKFLAFTLLLQPLLIFAAPSPVAAKPLQQSQSAALENKDKAPATESANQSDARKKVMIPNGTPIEIEAPYEVSSQEVKEGEAISFRVIDPVTVDAAIVIAAGATVTAKVVRATRGGHFGRAGQLEWTMQDVRAVDGSRVPLQYSGRKVGDSKGAKVATGIVVTAALLWPIAPIALLHGFKRGENAFIPAGKRFTVTVNTDSVVTIP